jgi:hypothetical protein
MLAEFQQALVDLTASPTLSSSVRLDPSVLDTRYKLTARERDRILGIVLHSGMACACMVYRSNRLAPLAMNVPRTCRALGPRLRGIVEEFWAAFPEANVHFFVEADRFCRFLQARIAEGRRFSTDVVEAVDMEGSAVAAALHESYIERVGA